MIRRSRVRGVGSVNWRELPSPPSLAAAHLEIRAYGAYEARDHLKALSYTFVSAGKYWAKAVDAEGFDFESLLAEAWVPAVGRVEVSSDAGELLYSRGI